MYALILPLGIVNLALVAIQILSGLRIVKISYKYHKYFGIALGFGALSHAAIAIFFT
jgi:hypothetical protein